MSKVENVELQDNPSPDPPDGDGLAETDEERTIYEQYRELLDNGQSIPASWKQPSERQEQALEGKIAPSELGSDKMDGGVPVDKE